VRRTRGISSCPFSRRGPEATDPRSPGGSAGIDAGIGVVAVSSVAEGRRAREERGRNVRSRGAIDPERTTDR
jgi:hypothetical protein